MGAYSDKSPLAAVYHISEDGEFLLRSTSGRMLVMHTGAVSTKSTRNTIGVQVMTLKGNHRLKEVLPFRGGNGEQGQPLPHQIAASGGRYALGGGYRGAADVGIAARHPGAGKKKPLPDGV